MTNIEKWLLYARDFVSPESFIRWGYYSLISAALQRRVWLGSDHKKLFGNMFNILVGPPACGKGLVIGEVSNVLSHKKLLKSSNLEENRTQLKEELGADFATTNADYDMLSNMIIPVAANSTTYESLCRTLTKVTKPLWFTKEEDGKVVRRPEFHSSILFRLEELGSLFRKHTEDIHTFCCETYDCKNEYEYRTKNQGVDYIRRPCVSIFAGTTPDFLKRVFSSSILTEGFASRAVFVVEQKNRFRYYHTPTFTEEQLNCFNSVVDHVAKVARIQGLCRFSPEASEFNKQWYEVEYGVKVPNPHPKLQAYYGRIGITHAKLCMAMHYGETVDTNEISLKVAQDALAFLQATEKNMHLALAGETKNPLAAVTEQILKYIQVEGECTNKQLKIVFYDDLIEPETDISTILNHLLDSGKIMKAESGRPNAYKPIIKDK